MQAHLSRYPLLCLYGLDPQTSTVSISQAIWERMRLSECKLHGRNRPAPNLRLFSWQ